MFENKITCQETLEQWDAAAGAYAADNRKFVPNMQDLDVLDAGCGNGWDSFYFANHGANIKACDSSPSMLTLARKAYPQPGFD